MLKFRPLLFGKGGSFYQPPGSLIFCCENKVANNMKFKKKTSGFDDGTKLIYGLIIFEQGLTDYPLA